MKAKTTVAEFIAKIEAAKGQAGVDLSTSEDLSLAVMNLISLEEHFFFTAVKTGKEGYFDTAQVIRSERKKWLAELLPNNEGETWCIAKHLLGAAMRLIEVGNKLQANGDRAKAAQAFASAYKVYSLFWGLRLQLIDGRGIKKAAKDSATFEDLVSKLVDCCDE